MIIDYLAIALGGALGATIRYGVAELLPVGSGGIPWATLIVNVTGAFLLGALARGSEVRARWVLFAGVGLLGSLTTFSTLALELSMRSSASLALTYALSTAILGIGAAWLGAELMERWEDRE